MRVYLTGFMAAGKTAVGISLAGALGFGFHDLDQAVEGRAGESVRQVFANRGEDAFRDLEHECLKETANLRNAVVATGGGTMAFERNRTLIRALGISVWLDPGLATILSRLARSNKDDRPLSRDEDQVRSLYQGRLDAYSMSDLRVRTTSGDTAQTVAGRIAALLRERNCAI